MKEFVIDYPLPTPNALLGPVVVDAIMEPPPVETRDLLSVISERAAAEASAGDPLLLRFVIEHSDLKTEFRELLATTKRQSDMIHKLRREPRSQHLTRLRESRDDARDARDTYRQQLQKYILANAEVAKLNGELVDQVHQLSRIADAAKAWAESDRRTAQPGEPDGELVEATWEFWSDRETVDVVEVREPAPSTCVSCGCPVADGTALCDDCPF